MTAKKTTGEEGQEQSEAVAQVNVQAMADQLRQAQEMIAILNEQNAMILAALQAKGQAVETPPVETTAYRDLSETPQRLRPGQSLGEGAAAGWVPWRKADLDSGGEKHNFVPQYIPGLVHPLKDEKGKYKIFLDVNDLQCLLTVGELNENVSGMFYHAYMNAEDEYRKSEEFKNSGPMQALWARGGPGNSNTWHFEGEAPAAWIAIDGSYYRPGKEMPLAEIPDSRPV